MAIATQALSRAFEASNPLMIKAAAMILQRIFTAQRDRFRGSTVKWR
jgi:hypothetical protein